MQRAALIKSVILHILIVILISVSFKFNSDKELKHSNIADIQIITDINSVKPVKQSPPKIVEKPKLPEPPKPKEAPKPKEEPKPFLPEDKPIVPPVKEKPQPETPPKMPVKKPVEPPKPEPAIIPKKEEPQTPQVKPSPKVEKKEEKIIEQKAEEKIIEKPAEEKKEPPKDFEDILKGLKDIPLEEEKKNIKNEVKIDEVEVKSADDIINKFLPEESPNILPKSGIPLNMSERENIRRQIMRNWSIQGVSSDKTSIVTLIIDLAPDGSVSYVDIEDKRRYNSDPFYRALVESAQRAVYKSSPLQNLPVNKYDIDGGWRRIKLNFDPSEIY